MTYNTHCFIQGCKTTVFNKPTGVNFFPCPTSNEMRNKWLHVLKNKCSLIDWARSRICSRHFELKYFDSQRRLRDNAIPTLFPVKPSDASKPRLDRLLNKMTQSELSENIKEELQLLNEPFNLENGLNDNLKCKTDVSEKTKLWLIIKKQEHLNARLSEAIAQNRRHAEMLQKTVDEYKNKRKDKDQTAETYKYIVKCLQEKLATYEEQIEILTAVESV
ncbi:uncharacterized protein [Epargyreus clarus]|uniref:uncharacterized protein n=1 Tax=Epargyreus clarus TaxID=520877 RepID=UPI003C2DBA74